MYGIIIRTNTCIPIVYPSSGRLENSKFFKDDNRVVFGDQFDTFTVPGTVNTGKVDTNTPLLTPTQTPSHTCTPFDLLHARIASAHGAGWVDLFPFLVIFVRVYAGILRS